MVKASNLPAGYKELEYTDDEIDVDLYELENPHS